MAMEPANPRRPAAERNPTAADLPDAAVAAIFAPFPAAGERGFVVAQLGQSLDGRIATAHGESRSINRDAALDHLHRLRAHVDAVVVGIGTVLADDPQLTVRRVAGRSPARVVIDPAGRLPLAARCLAADGAPRLILRARDTKDAPPLPPGVEKVRLPRQGAALAPAAIVAALAARGYRRLLIEGGARTVSAFVDAGCLDRLHVLVSPMLIGSGTPGLTLKPVKALVEARRPATRVFVLPDGDVLFDCDLRRDQAGETT